MDESLPLAAIIGLGALFVAVIGVTITAAKHCENLVLRVIAILAAWSTLGVVIALVGPTKVWQHVKGTFQAAEPALQPTSSPIPTPTATATPRATPPAATGEVPKGYVFSDSIDLSANSPWQKFVDIEQGERLRIELHPSGGAALTTQIIIQTESRKGRWTNFEMSPWETMHDWTMKRPPPGKKVLVGVLSRLSGRVLLKIEKIGGKE